ncbi:DMP19 family protein [Campylobacter curvus]|uniref:DMP19 family protein n=1 Tax=Campylobacter curvus TaxID=200 RepID=UPI0014701899|nr:DMP19 family protein [Campylobacter curvus]
MVQKHIVITKKTIENLNEDNYFDVIEPLWFSVDIYDSYEIYERTLQPFSREQRYVFATEWLIAEVGNGGFEQFFDNSTGIVLKDALDGFRQLGCDDALSVIERVMECYGVFPSLDRKTRWAEMENISDEEWDKIDALDSEFYELEIYPKMLSYIKANADKFLFDGVVDTE